MTSMPRKKSSRLGGRTRAAARKVAKAQSEAHTALWWVVEDDFGGYIAVPGKPDHDYEITDVYSAGKRMP